MKKSRYIAAIAIVAVTQSLQAAEANSLEGFRAEAWSWIYENMVFVVAGLLITGVVLSLYTALNKVIVAQTHAYLKEHGITIPEKAPTPNVLAQLYDKAWALVPIDKESEINLHHDYDGIEELDNRLPPWWVYLFYATIVWAGIYVYIYHFSDIGMSQQEEYEYAMEKAEDEKVAYLATQANAVDETNVTALTDAAALSSGESIFKANCSACHGQMGEGGVGPNLTDPYWVHGGGVVNVFKTIKYGVPEKGMIAWKAQLPASAMQQLASYILTLEGTDPPNGKAPEGLLYESGSSTITASN